MCYVIALATDAPSSHIATQVKANTAPTGCQHAGRHGARCTGWLDEIEVIEIAGHKAADCPKKGPRQEALRSRAIEAHKLVKQQTKTQNMENVESSTGDAALRAELLA
ncbi:hypothetical protein SVAN01_09995 [Stagonosporopsis vannaccii]|nr:hypothetical protein SVAN01_09995 [Stagonosporopsis vannaccii]